MASLSTSTTTPVVTPSTPAPQRVLLFGGTFNPVHFGHLRSALECHYLLGFDTVWLIPNAQQPLKDYPSVTAAQRLVMIEQAIADHPQLRCSTIEIERGDVSYTFDTLSALKAEYPEIEFSWQLGQDALNQFHRWYHWEALLDLANWVIVPRPGYQPDYPPELSDALADRWQTPEDFLRKDSAGQSLPDSLQCGKIVRVTTTQMALSSTYIRALAQQSLPCDFLVPAAVSRYIAQQRLYQPAHHIERLS